VFWQRPKNNGVRQQIFPKKNQTLGRQLFLVFYFSVTTLHPAKPSQNISI
jgi:hypothetical protein